MAALRPCYNCRRCPGRGCQANESSSPVAAAAGSDCGTGWRPGGAEVAYLEVYRREKPAVSRAVMKRAWRDETPDAVVVTSLAGLNNLIEMTPASEQARLRATALVVMSERIERQALKQGFFRVGAAADNSDAGLVSALVKMNEAGQMTKGGDEHEKRSKLNQRKQQRRRPRWRTKLTPRHRPLAPVRRTRLGPGRNPSNPERRNSTLRPSRKNRGFSRACGA